MLVRGQTLAIRLALAALLLGGSWPSLAAADGFVENWNSASSLYFVPKPPLFIFFNTPEAAANDGRVLRLQLPANPSSGPDGGPEIGSKTKYLYGRFSTRLKTADCAAQPKAGVVTGYFTFFNDRNDYNNNGLPDNSEIDFEWLGAEPEVVYLTMWTDYRGSDGAQRKVGRAINLRTGQILYTCYFEAFGQCQPLSGAESQPTAIQPLPDYNSATAFYEYGFDWTPVAVTWWMTNPADGKRLVLWDYRGPITRIPSVAAYYMTNVWYTPNWYPDGMPDAIQRPTAPISALVDWTQYKPRAEKRQDRFRQGGSRTLPAESQPNDN